MPQALPFNERVVKSPELLGARQNVTNFQLLSCCYIYAILEVLYIVKEIELIIARQRISVFATLADATLQRTKGCKGIGKNEVLAKTLRYKYTRKMFASKWMECFFMFFGFFFSVCAGHITRGVVYTFKTFKPLTIGTKAIFPIAILAHTRSLRLALVAMELIEGATTNHRAILSTRVKEEDMDMETSRLGAEVSNSEIARRDAKGATPILAPCLDIRSNNIAFLVIGRNYGQVLIVECKSQEKDARG